MGKIRPFPSLSLAVTTLWMIGYWTDHLKLLECGFLCEGLGLDSPRQTKGCDFTHILECYVVAWDRIDQMIM